MTGKIFISHRSIDKEIADMLRDYLVGVGISNDLIFCSSLPGNGIAQSISREVKESLKNSVVSIVILSRDYYKSAYCLNEAGIIWFLERSAITVALPEIEPSDMYGFLDSSDNILRRLNNADDINCIYDNVRRAVSADQVSAAITGNAAQKLIDRYNMCIESRTIAARNNTESDGIVDAERQRFIGLIDENIIKANTLLPSTLKYVLRSSLVRGALNNIHIDRFVVVVQISRFDANNKAAVKVDRSFIGQASPNCSDMIVPFIHSVHKERNGYKYSIIDENTQLPMICEFGFKESFETLRITLAKQAKKGFNILLSIEDNPDSPSFNDENKVQAFLADPHLLFSSWKYTQIVFHSDEERIRNRIGRLFYVNRNTYAWEHIVSDKFDSEGILRFEITADDMEKCKDCLIVVLLERS